MKKIRVFLVDDHRLFRNGLVLLLGGEPDITVVGEAANGREFIDRLEEPVPDIVLMDIDMPVMDGVAATEEACSRHPELKILTLTMYGDENYYYRMIDAGARGFILKDSDIQEVTRAIRSVHSGGTYFSQEILYHVIRSIREVEKQKDPPLSLSPRELDVLREICCGSSNQEIAGSLHISKRTVEKHRANLLLKTQSRNSASLVMYAVHNNLIPVD
jgi:DNA-binding NarL/FixJ family response regulator